MDTSQQPVICDTDIRCLEWFFGYGGNHLGLKRAIPNLRLIAACEIEAYACANVVAKMEAGLLDSAPVWTNCKTFPLAPFRGLVDIFIASYPCQGFSSAGKREGQKDPRFLWPWVLRAIAIIQPRYCFFENVDAHVTLGLSTVLSDLEEAGYRHEAGIYSAAECGAPQQRKRVFILAENKSLRESGMGHALCQQIDWHITPGFQPDTGRAGQLENAADRRRGFTGSSQTLGVGLADSECARPQGRQLARTHDQGPSAHGPITQRRPIFWPGYVSRPGQPQHVWEPARVIETQRRVGRSTDGCATGLDRPQPYADASENVDRLRLLGNGVYPAAACNAFLTLHAKLCKTH